MTDRGFEMAVRALHDGKIAFDEFERLTRPRWQQLAAYIARRWHLPCWASSDDLVQELLVAAWDAIWKWDPKRSGDASDAALARYVIWNAVDKAKKSAHRMRGAATHRNADGNPGRPERPFAMWGDKAERVAELMLRQDADQEAAMLAAEEELLALRRARGACKNRIELRTVEALAKEGDVYAAVLSLYEDVDARLDCAFKDETHAVRAVVRAAAAVAARLERVA